MIRLGCAIVMLTGADGRPVGAPAGALAVVDGLAEDAEAAVALVPHHGAPVAADGNVAAVSDHGEVGHVAGRPAAHCKRAKRVRGE